MSFYRDGRLLNTQDYAPYSCIWDTTTAVDGSEHVLKAVAHDALGNTASTRIRVKVRKLDTTPPDTTITSGTSGTITTNAASFSFSSSESGLSFQCSLDGGAFGSCASPKPYTNPPDGAHSFGVRATDAATNADASPASRSFTVDTAPPPDTTPPDTTITSGPSGTITTNAASFSFSSSESGSSFQCSLDGGAFGSCASPKPYTNLPDGAHSFGVRATDAATNADASPASRSFTVDTGGSAGAGYPSLANVSWDGDFDSGCQLLGSASGAWSTNETNGDYTGGSTTIERSIVGEGQCAARFTDSPSNTMVRSELGRSPTGADPEYTFEMLVYVPSGQTFPKGTSLTQTKMERGADGRGCYGGGWGISDGTGTAGGKLDLNTVFACTTPQANGQHDFAAGLLPRDRWFALKVHEKFSNNPQVGFVEAWKDDDGPGPGGYVQVVPKTHLDNESSGQHVRLRIGSYRQATDHATTIYIDGSHLDCASNC